MAKKKVRIGDVFTIEIKDGVIGCGQVVSMWKTELYVVIFKETFNKNCLPEPSDIANFTPIFASSTLDAKLWHGHWNVIGNSTSNIDSISKPFYKVQHDSKWVLESFDRSYSREANAKEVQSLKLRKCVAPVRLEKALKAQFGEGEWDSIYEELKYEQVLSSCDVVSM